MGILSRGIAVNQKIIIIIIRGPKIINIIISFIAKE